MRRHKDIRLTLSISIAVIALALVVPAAAQAKEAWQFSITGRGFGHGIGMSQYGAYGCAREGWSYRQILQHYYTGIGFGSSSNRSVRVLLTDGQASIGITCAGAYTATVGSTNVSLAANTKATVTWTGSAFKLAAAGKSWTSANPIVFKRAASSNLVMVNRNFNGWSTTANAPYRGTLTVARLSNALCVVNTLAMESYLRGVVPREMPSSWPAEALKAQAVAARTYTVRHLGSSGIFDLYCDTRSQAYSGSGGETTATTAAVSATSGVIATYAGNPIAAFYFSTSGGYTENIENVWLAAAQPYLKGVPDPYETSSPYHVWPDNPLLRSSSAVSTALNGLTPSGDLEALYVVRRGVSRRVVRALALSSSGGAAIHGSTLRARLGLRDSWLDIRSLSIDPASTTSITAGSRLVLKGRTYPALSAGKTVALKYKRDGVWRSVTVPTTSITNTVRKVTVGGVTYSTTYSSFSYTVKPPATTEYSFAYGSSCSPTTTVRVTTSASPSPSTSPSPSASPSPSPSASASPSPSPSASASPSPSPSASASPSPSPSPSPATVTVPSSLSIAPLPSATIAAGGSVRLTGHICPVVPAGTPVILHYKRSGVWKHVTVPATGVTRGTRRITVNGTRYTYRFTSYRYTVSPPATTIYYFSVGKYRSPSTVVKVARTTGSVAATATFLPMSIAPLTDVSMRAGSSVRLTGRIYPAIPSDAPVILHYKRDGVWRCVRVPTEWTARGTQRVTVDGAQYTYPFSSYRYAVSPPATTTYYFSVGRSRSPNIVVRVTK
jgi:stage II sporulation protein D